MTIIHKTLGKLQRKEGSFIGGILFWVVEIYDVNDKGEFWVNTYNIRDIRNEIISFPESFLGYPHSETEQVDRYIRLTENFP